MTLQDRIQDVTQKFNTKQAEHSEHTRAAEECMAEMNRLQGEFRLLNELIEEKTERNEGDDRAAEIINAIEEEK